MVTSPRSVDELRSGFLDPPTSSAPMMRWWWFGPSVRRAEIDRELTAMRAIGLGGVEVAYVYPLGPESEKFLSSPFLADLRYAAETARGLGLRFDLTLGSGWSFGGPHVTSEHAAQKLHWERRELPPGSARIPAVASWPGDVLVAAYLGAGSMQEQPEELTRLPVVDGVLQVPDGTGPRLVLLAYARLTGQNVKRAAFGAEGPVLDHYSAEAARLHLAQVGDPLLDAVPAQLVGSVFCDSLEVYGSDWTSDMGEEFRIRRGYDLLPGLYRLVVDGPGATQLRADYHRTLTELYEEYFVAEFQRWAAARGVAFRIQGYGTPPAMISSYRFADLFEGEGWGWTELTQTRWATSAAHLYGREVVSSEVWTWVHSPSFRATPLDLKGEAHEHLLAGINHLIGHGWPYSPADGPGLGWFFYAAGALDDRNPWWPAMSPLVRYLNRLCWLMRQGSPVSDVLVYICEQDVFARMGTAVGGSLDAWREAREVVGDEVTRVVREGGWDFDLIDDDSLAVLPADESRPVILSGSSGLSAAAQAWLDRYLSAGGSVIAVNSDVALAGAAFCAVDDLTAVLSAAAGPGVGIRPAGTDIGVVHRRMGDADIHLVVNTGRFAQSFTMAPRSDRGSYEEWDAESGQLLRAGPVSDGIDITLHPYQATVVVLTDREPPPSATDRADADRPRRRIALSDGWQVQFADRGRGVAIDLPHVWENDPDHQAFSGSATYRRTVDLPDLGPSATAALAFSDPAALAGRQSEAHGIRGPSYRAEVDPPVGVMAEIRVNDIECGMVWAPPYAVDVSRAVVAGSNRIEIVVRNTAANALAHDGHIWSLVADAERRYGRRFRMQELDRAMDGVQSGLFAAPMLVVLD